MKTPFTQEQFFEIFHHYNEAVFPMQIIFFLLSVVVIYLVIRPSPASNKIIAGILSFLWIWMGIVYHLVFFTPINPAAYVFSAVFVLQGLLFFLLGVFQNKLLFRFRFDGYGLTGISLIVFALIVYPAAGIYLGHHYPYSPTFGLPCPTTIFTFGVLLQSEKKCPLLILLIPFIWSIIGFTAAFNFGIVEDTGLIVAGVTSTILLLIRNRRRRES